jgi:hypothetical protein
MKRKKMGRKAKIEDIIGTPKYILKVSLTLSVCFGLRKGEKMRKPFFKTLKENKNRFMGRSIDT